MHATLPSEENLSASMILQRLLDHGKMMIAHMLAHEESGYSEALTSQNSELEWKSTVGPR